MVTMRNLPLLILKIREKKIVNLIYSMKFFKIKLYKFKIIIIYGVKFFITEVLKY